MCYNPIDGTQNDENLETHQHLQVSFQAEQQVKNLG